MLSVIKYHRELHPGDGYFNYHAPRFSVLLDRLERHHSAGDRVLEIGPSRFSSIVAEHLDCAVDTLGFGADAQTATGQHWRYNLNQCHDTATWRTGLGAYDHVLFAEVIEHLHTAPVTVLKFIHSIMASGGALYLQTPNAAVLHKRLILLAGKNPYQEIQADRMNPGHFREYTRTEITRFAGLAGFAIEHFFYGNYFDYRYTRHVSQGGGVLPILRAVNWLYELCPGSLKPGMTFILRKD